MKSRTLTTATLLLLASCRVMQPTGNDTEHAWHRTETVTPSTSSGSTIVVPPAIKGSKARGRSVVTDRDDRRLPIAEAADEKKAKPVSTAIAPALTAVLPKAELQRADSLLNTLQAQNKAADTLEQTVIADNQHITDLSNTVRQATSANGSDFKFRATNIRPTDTVFIDSKGVQLALWIGPNGIEQKIAKGAVVSRDVDEDGTGLTVQPGFDWEPYRVTLLIVGSVAALTLMSGLIYSLFPTPKPAISEQLA